MKSPETVARRPIFASPVATKVWNKAILEALLICCAAIGFSVYFTYPLAFHLGDRLPELGDSRLNAYIDAWVTHSLTTRPSQLFDTNMFYPARNTLALSENLLGNQLLFAPVYLLTKNPVTAQNFVILASFFLSAVTMYWLLRSSALSAGASAAGALVYGFALPRMGQLNHMQLLSTEWMPLIVLFLFSYLTSGKVRDLAVGTGALVMQVLCSLYLGYLSALIVICYVAAAVCLRPDWVKRRVWRNLALGGIAALVLLIPVLRPYLKLQHHDVIPRQNTFAVAASASPIASYLNVAGFSHQIYARWLGSFNSPQAGMEKRLFVGFVPLLLAAAGAYSLRGKLMRPKTADATGRCATSPQAIHSALILGSMFTVVAAYVLSLGPVLRINEHATHLRLPFFLLQRWVPGMGAFRVPARFVFAFLFGIAMLAAFGCEWLLERLPLRNLMRIGCCLILLVLIGLEFSVVPVDLAAVMAPPGIAPEYRWLAAQRPGSVTLELPISGPVWRPDPFEQAGYVYASVYHWQPLINGYSGYIPPTARRCDQLARQLPDPEPLDALAALGLKYVVVHEDKLPATALERWQPAPKGLRLAARFEDKTAIFAVDDSDQR